MFPFIQVFPIVRTVHSLRQSEIEYTFVVMLTDATAIVTEVSNPVGTWDVAFGVRSEISDVHLLSYSLHPGETVRSGIRALIWNDFNAEDNETFTLRVSPMDFCGITCDFKCYNDGDDPVEGNYFCSHTVTIVDGEGQ